MMSQLLIGLVCITCVYKVKVYTSLSTHTHTCLQVVTLTVFIKCFVAIYIYILLWFDIYFFFLFPLFGTTVTSSGGQCTQPSYPKICSLVWRLSACINTWIFYGMQFFWHFFRLGGSVLDCLHFIIKTFLMSHFLSCYDL